MSKLLFVYNADTGFFNLAADVAHKIFSPSTYPCSLCAVTHGVFSIRPEWENFVKESEVEMEFLHRDEFQAQYSDWKAYPLPAVFKVKSDGTLESYLSAAQLNSIESLDELKEKVLGG